MLFRSLKLATANGIIIADERIDMEIQGLGTTVDPLVLDETVNAISVGRLVLDGEFSFHWPAGESAYLVDKDGHRTECQTKGYVPVIKHAWTQDVAECLPCAPPGDAEDADLPSDEQHDEGAQERLKREASSPEHMATHRPKNPYCWVCGLSKMTAKPARRVPHDDRKVNNVTV